MIVSLNATFGFPISQGQLYSLSILWDDTKHTGSRKHRTCPLDHIRDVYSWPAMSKRRGSGSNNRKWRARVVATHLRVDFQVEFAHARDDGFSALCVKVHSKGRIFFGESVNSFGEFILIILAKGKVINLGLSRGRSAFYLRYKLKYVRTLLEGLIAMEMTGSGTWIDSCWINIQQDYSTFLEKQTNDSNMLKWAWFLTICSPWRGRSWSWM